MAALAEDLSRALAGTAAAAIVRACFTNTWTSAMRWSTAFGQEEVFVATGDIPAMWLRDSAAQVRPYLALAHDDTVGRMLVGVLRRQLSSVEIDPYANAFNDGPTDAHPEQSDVPRPAPAVWERKYEVDSLCAPLQLGYAIWRATGRVHHLDEQFVRVSKAVIALWRTEQDHAGSGYRFRRTEGEFATDSLPRHGRGAPVGPTGMTWSGFRPSDDRCTHRYLVPANALASSSLHGLAELAHDVLLDDELERDSVALATEIDAGIERFGVHERDGERIFAYELDGLGSVLLGDDANLPNLLGLPLSGWLNADDPVYQATRRFVLSQDNPHHYAGEFASGLGSSHTPRDHVWPLAIATVGLTGDENDATRALHLLGSTTGGTGLMHESFHVDDPTRFTRSWFGWANAMFSELALDLAGRSVKDYFPRRSAAVTTASPASTRP
ncbi:glycoside hydrolase family 125 protein [Humibacter antri]